MTTLAQISETQAQKSTTANENFDAVSPAGMFGRKATTTSGLTWGYYGGMLDLDGVLTAISDGTVALTASNTNYIEATRAGVVSANITGFTAGRIPLYTAVVGASTITSYIDQRDLSARPTRRLLSKSIAGGAGDTTLTAAEARVDILILTGALTGNRTVTVPAVAWPFVVYNNTSGAFTATVKTAAGSGVAVAQGKRAILYCDGVNVVTGFDDSAAMGLGTIATQNANNVAITGGSITGTAVDNCTIGGVTPAAATMTTGHVTGNLTVDGDLLVSGDTVTVNVATMEVEDPLMELGSGNGADSVDLGLYGDYKPAGTTLFGGLFRDASDGKWKLFKDLQNEPTSTVNTAGTGYAIATLLANHEDGGGSTLKNPANTTQTLTDGASIDWDASLGACGTVTLGAAGRTMNAPSNLKAGGFYVLRVLQDGTGNRTITSWNGVFDWGGATAPTLSTAASAEDIFSFYSPDGTNLKNIGAVYALG